MKNQQLLGREGYYKGKKSLLELVAEVYKESGMKLNLRRGYLKYLKKYLMVSLNQLLHS